MAFDAEAIIAQLRLEVHPEGGAYRELFRAAHEVTRADGSVRSASTLIWFLLRHGEVSVWHRVHGADEVWHWVDGGPLELTWIERGTNAHRIVLGSSRDGFASSAVVPADAWQMARPLDDPALVQCGVAPGFDFQDFAMLRDVPDALAALRAAHPTLITPETVAPA
jgi:uncharacterized protein